MHKNEKPLGLPTPAVARIAGVRRQTLDHWARTGLVTPSYRASSGRRRTRWWSVVDVLAVRTIKALRDAGCPLQTVRRATQLLRETGVSLSSVVLFWDGGDVVALEEWGTVRSLVRRPGQQLLHIVALPMGTWVQDARAAGTPVDLQQLRAGSTEQSSGSGRARHAEVS